MSIIDFTGRLMDSEAGDFIQDIYGYHPETLFGPCAVLRLSDGKLLPLYQDKWNPDKVNIFGDDPYSYMVREGGIPDVVAHIKRRHGVCAGKDCTNEPYPQDHTGHCLDCNPYGDSPVMNNSPEYQRWLFSNSKGAHMPQLKYGPKCKKNYCRTRASWGVKSTDLEIPKEYYSCGKHLTSVIRETRYNNEETVEVRELWC